MSIVSFWVNHAMVCKAKGISPLFSAYEGHMPNFMWDEVFNTYGFELVAQQSIHADPNKPDEEVNPINMCSVYKKIAA
jgi:hypothetical protein